MIACTCPCCMAEEIEELRRQPGFPEIVRPVPVQLRLPGMPLAEVSA